jgi:tRNA pseudouridine38-40 synthase
MRLAFRVCYLGDHFYGSQLQPDQRTVEGEFIAACEETALFSDWREAGFSFAGRTDRGVHARGQVCAFSTTYPDRAIQALNYHLPADIWCTAAAAVPDDFKPRYAAGTRTYHYYLPAGELDIAAMADAAAVFVGTHDFSRFSRPEGKDPCRTVLSASVHTGDDLVVFEVCGLSFLWNMVRCMATALISAGSGTTDAAAIRQLLKNPGGTRLAAAPPEGLVLWDVDCGLAFEPMVVDHKSIRFLDELHRRATIMKKITECLSGTPD